MLRELILENFVLIKKAHLLFEPGFTVFTGETGAGKSLLVKAVKLLMGERQLQGVIHPGESRAVLQGVFDPTPEVSHALESHGLPLEDALIIHRVFSGDSRSRAYINGKAITLTQLRSVTRGLLSIAGQHEYQGLLKSDTPMKWLDTFGNLEQEKRAMEEAHRRFKEAASRLERLKGEIEAARMQKDAIRAELEEIDRIAPQEGEEEELLAEIERLRAFTTLRELAEAAFGDLYASKGSAEESLASALRSLEKIASIDTTVEGLAERIESTVTEVREVAFEMREYLQGLAFDPGRLDQLESRLNAIRRLLLRYGPTIRDCLKKRDELRAVLDTMERPDEVLGEAERELQEATHHLLECAERLSHKRREASRHLEDAVNQEIQGLFANRARFEVAVEAPHPVPPHAVGPEGMDRVRFLFSPNPGLPKRPLKEVASGGELSRVMLALRIATSQGYSMATTVLFDEIDAGIGGQTAHLVGAKLRRLSESMQVICVSHFPQVASKANGHFVVTKKSDGNSTWTEIVRLQGEQRVKEIARMLGGGDEEALNYAKRLLNLEGHSK